MQLFQLEIKINSKDATFHPVHQGFHCIYACIDFEYHLSSSKYTPLEPIQAY